MPVNRIPPRGPQSDTSSNVVPKVKVYNRYEGITQRAETNSCLILFLEGEDVGKMYPEMLIIFSNNDNILWFHRTRTFLCH